MPFRTATRGLLGQVQGIRARHAGGHASLRIAAWRVDRLRLALRGHKRRGHIVQDKDHGRVASQVPDDNRGKNAAREAPGCKQEGVCEANVVAHHAEGPLASQASLLRHPPRTEVHKSNMHHMHHGAHSANSPEQRQGELRLPELCKQHAGKEKVEGQPRQRKRVLGLQHALLPEEHGPSDRREAQQKAPLGLQLRVQPAGRAA
mmetsp:Transcript_16748/g.48967  ORF Transcript_16748/g.48967 Transcript_16748/m.48967 type:complete len:204 (-) Transcript_16748:5-616(-)